VLRENSLCHGVALAIPGRKRGIFVRRGLRAERRRRGEFIEETAVSFLEWDGRPWPGVLGGWGRRKIGRGDPLKDVCHVHRTESIKEELTCDNRRERAGFLSWGERTTLKRSSPARGKMGESAKARASQWRMESSVPLQGKSVEKDHAQRGTC